MSSINTDWASNPQLEQALDDVHTRFLLNLPSSELATADRIFFQLEQAWWFYEDLICDTATCDISSMPRFSSLKPFAKLLFEFSPLFPNDQFAQMWSQFSDYKRKISTYGTILLNQEATHLILCQVWNGETWTLPAGKINQGESGIQAAARETFEETGFDPHCIFGETKEWTETDPQNITWKYPLPEGKSSLSYQEPTTGKRRTCYVCHGVPADFDFAPVARKEVSKVQWFPIDEDLPKKTFAVLPFMGKLRAWIRRNVHNNKSNSRPKSRPKSNDRDKSSGRDKSNGRTKPRDKRSNSSGRMISVPDDPLVDTGLATVGDKTRWTEEEMFKANEQLLGRTVDYDGNPHVFSEKGFNGVDPHAFRVVGGSFMNTSEGLSEKLMEDRKEKYQPLVNSNVDGATLTPFFSSDGETPWGDVVEEVKQAMHHSNSNKSPKKKTDGETPWGDVAEEVKRAMNNNNSNKSSKKKNKKSKQQSQSQDVGQALLAKLQSSSTTSAEPDALDVFTDAQITQKSQSQKLKYQKYQDDTKFIQDWVAKLPRPKHFRIDVDDILP
jgi:mRNA-decapping enzyme subunit 2